MIVITQIRRHLFRLYPIWRRFASLATSDSSSSCPEHTSRRLDIVQIDHYDMKNGTVRLLNLLDGMPTASTVNLGTLNYTGPLNESFNPLKGLTGSFVSVDVLKGKKRRILIFDPVTNKALSFRKPYPRKVRHWTNLISEPIYMGRCQQQSLCGVGAITKLKIVELYDIDKERPKRRAIGCDICTLDDIRGHGITSKQLEWRSVMTAAANLHLGRQIISLDDCFCGDNVLCWGIHPESSTCDENYDLEPWEREDPEPWERDDIDSWSRRQLIYQEKLVKAPTRVGCILEAFLSLDLVTETLKISPFPPALLQRPNSSRMHLCNLEGRPSICLLPKAHNRTGNLEVWMLKRSDSFKAEALGDLSSWFLRCSIPANRLPSGYVGPLALWQGKLFLIHEWAEDRHVDWSGRARRRLIYYDLCSEELSRVVLDNGDEVEMDARSHIAVYDETLAPTHLAWD